MRDRVEGATDIEAGQVHVPAFTAVCANEIVYTTKMHFRSPRGPISILSGRQRAFQFRRDSMIYNCFQRFSKGAEKRNGSLRGAKPLTLFWFVFGNDVYVKHRRRYSSFNKNAVDQPFHHLKCAWHFLGNLDGETVGTWRLSCGEALHCFAGIHFRDALEGYFDI